jgi:hypothetical protein
MRRGRTLVGLLLGALFSTGLVPPGSAGEQRTAEILPFEGQVRSIKIDHCGLTPGTCTGSIVLATKEAGEVILAIRPGTWIKRGETLVVVEELGVGNYIKVQAAQIGRDATPRITVLTTP